MNNKPANIVQNIGWISLANVVTKPLWLVFIILSARILGAGDFGIFMFLIAISYVIGSIVELGLDLQIIRSISPDKNKAGEKIKVSIFVRLICSLIFGLTAVLLYQLLFAADYPPLLFTLAILFGIQFFFVTHLRAIFRSVEIVKFEAISVITEKAFTTVAGLFVLYTSADLIHYVVVYNVGLFLAILYSLYILRRLTGFALSVPSWPEVKALLVPAKPFAILNIIQVTFTRLGTLLIERLSGNPVWVGFHNAGARFAESFIVFPNTIIAAVYPVMCRVYSEHDKIWNLASLSARILLFISIPVGLTMFTANHEFTNLVFGDEYLEAAHAIGWFGLSIIASSQVFVFGSIVSASGRQAASNRLLMVAFPISLLSYILFIPPFGFLAAAIITFADQAALLLINLWVGRTMVKLRSYIFTLVKCLIFPVIGYFGYQTGLLSQFSDLSVLAVLAIWNASGILVTRTLSLSDIREIRALQATYAE